MPVEMVVLSSEMPWINNFLLAEAECWKTSEFCSSVFYVVTCWTVIELGITSQALEGNTEFCKAGMITDLNLCSSLLLTVMDHVNTLCAAIITADPIASAFIHHMLMLQGQEMIMNLRSCDYSGMITVAAVVTLSYSHSTVAYECRCHSSLAWMSSGRCQSKS